MYIINDNIKGDKFRITLDNNSVIKSRHEIWAIADEHELDVVLVNSKTQPQVVKLMDYGKFMYEQSKKNKDRQTKARLTKIHIKQVQLSARIEKHDFETKLRHANEFLADGDTVEVVLRLKGREVSHKDIAYGIILDFVEKLINKKTGYKINMDGRDIKTTVESTVKKQIITS